MPEFLYNQRFSYSSTKAYYRFESGALTTDSTANAHTLTAISDPAAGTGKFGGCVDLDGDDAYSADDHADFKPTGSFGISAWIKTSTTGATQNIFHSYSANTKIAGIRLRINTSNVAEITIGKNTGTTADTDYKILAGTTNVCDNAWHYIAVEWTGSIIIVWVDGKVNTAVAWAGAPAYAATNYVRIGCGNNSGSNTNFLTGSIDDLVIFNGLTVGANTIKELYEGRWVGELFATGTPASMNGLWHLNGNSSDYNYGLYEGVDTAITYSLANGKFGKGAGFNGSSSKIVLPDGARMKPTTAFSVGAWFKTSTTNVIQSIFQTYSANTNLAGIFLGINSTNTAYCISGKNTGVTANVDIKTLSSAATFTDGVWHWEVLTWDTQNLSLYVDGAQVATAAWANAPAYAATNYVRIGCWNGAGTDNYFFNGALDEVFLLGRAMTAAEIRHWYAWSKGKYI